MYLTTVLFGKLLWEVAAINTEVPSSSQTEQKPALKRNYAKSAMKQAQ